MSPTQKSGSVFGLKIIHLLHYWKEMKSSGTVVHSGFIFFRALYLDNFKAKYVVREWLR